ncbi:hypothetical protein J0S82_003877 [Galemys pyrenaicus]|uniref:Uncharacterized protein n=1 Tax=Galemys pyrenaicus TaxID=202257 RepID=A0A8J6A8S9_GALPY|nr:hypothetical protein J0S82_003877 [Galemys pyrenaicus]
MAGGEARFAALSLVQLHELLEDEGQLAAMVRGMEEVSAGRGRRGPGIAPARGARPGGRAGPGRAGAAAPAAAGMNEAVAGAGTAGAEPGLEARPGRLGREDSGQARAGWGCEVLGTGSGGVRVSGALGTEWTGRPDGQARRSPPSGQGWGRGSGCF